jgi:lysophospholipase L1-like esterase
MRLAPSLRGNLLLALASAILTLVLFVLGYEVWQTARYRAWRARYDNKGWLGTLTVPSSDPVLMWEYRPHASHRSIETNRYGFRERDFDNERKPEGVWRVAFAGDSVTLGIGVAPDETFERRLEREAPALAAQHVQALNFGIDGYNTEQVAELVKTRVLVFEPDEVVYVMCLNDFDRTDSSAEKIRYFRKPKSFFLEDLRVLDRRLRGIEFHRYHFQKNRDATFDAILGMKRDVDSKRARFLVAIVPVFFEGHHDFSAYPLRDIHDAIAAFCRRNGIDAYDLLPDFERAGTDATSYALDPWHLSAAGHALAARALAPRVLPPAATSTAPLGQNGARETR